MFFAKLIYSQYILELKKLLIKEQREKGKIENIESLQDLAVIYAELERKSSFLANAARIAAKEKGIPLQTPQMASLFSFFFNENKVRNYDDAVSSSAELYKKFFAGCLKRGVYFAPSAF